MLRGADVIYIINVSHLRSFSAALVQTIVMCTVLLFYIMVRYVNGLLQTLFCRDFEEYLPMRTIHHTV